MRFRQGVRGPGGWATEDRRAPRPPPVSPPPETVGDLGPATFRLVSAPRLNKPELLFALASWAAVWLGAGCVADASSTPTPEPTPDVDDDSASSDDDSVPDDGDPTPEPAPPDLDGDGSPDAEDCAPFDPGVHPGAAEDCDGQDGDCDGSPSASEQDTDGDGWWPCLGDCDDLRPNVFPAAEERCNGRDDDCQSATAEDEDRDGDGASACAGDCDDTDPTTGPFEPERCNTFDDDCDPTTDETSDLDGDGHSAVCGGDCDDAAPTSFPAAPEACSGPDRDCDGAPPPTCSSCLALHAADPATASGPHLIDLDGAGALPAEALECEMDRAGGGWTLILRTTWDWAANEPMLTGLADFLATDIVPVGPLGARRLRGEWWDALSLAGELLVVATPRDRVTGQDCGDLWHDVYAPITAPAGVPELPSPVATRGVVLIEGRLLSTVDSGPSIDCVVAPNQNLPFFHGSCCTTCPTLDAGYWLDSPHPTVSWLVSPDAEGHDEGDRCPSGGALRPLIDGDYRGVNRLEFWVR